MSKKIIVNHLNIIRKLNDNAEPAKVDSLSRGKRIYNFSCNDVKRVFFIIEGDFFLRSSETGKIIKVISAPFVIGAMPSLEPLPVFIEMIDYGKIKSIDYHYFWSLVNYQGLLPDAMTVMSGYHTDLMKFINSHNENNEKHVRTLVDRWKYHPGHIKKKISLLFFITNSTFMSKSTAARIIKRMKETGCINLKNGRLVVDEN
ncbi:MULTISPECIES: helix-turn-helix domain-containing protein [Enterobacter cloacae complex]|uniref:helix-turn-helix domain-containing protein n=1 Tax=Enterobacter cloacae complex TaxID=354276 RepID=UPI00079A97CB|nr:helix-turn-helix domain-containing protein [Enterobacter ludwigii]WNI43070.1 helix-turn-helix domain-containing protein [Enterobacter ludwigii]WNI52050.1 helix-turn-helix domain-containing protein [Enterobacter ludwigii]WNI83897.1 helix-turn-helix domain-containing protein [Enterobacter ludwigii]SAC94690.1 Uncharacterised protein [Enterobacter ludwigii]